MTIDTKDLKVGDKVLIEATIDLISRDMTAIRVKDKASGDDFYFSLDQIHSILPREPKVGEIWLNKKQHVALKILHLERYEFVAKYANGCLYIDYLTDFNERYTFIPPKQHKDYGFE